MTRRNSLYLQLWIFAGLNAALCWVHVPSIPLRNILMSRPHVDSSGLRTYNGAVVIITGGASGIGRALAEDIVERGAQAVVVVDRQRTLAEEVVAGLVRRGADASVYDIDVRDFSEVKRMAEETKQKYGRIDYIFNNAGILILGPIESIGVEHFDYIFDVNVRGVHHGVQAAYPIMKEQGFGHIVNTSSLLGLIPGRQWAAAYSASKHAVVGLTTNLHVEAARYGIRVSLFCPGTIKTPIHTSGEYGMNLTGIRKETWDARVAKMKGMGVELCAAKTLDAVAKNKPIIVVPELPMMKSRLLYRLSPALWLHRAVNKVDRRKMQEEAAVSQSASKKDK